MPVPAAGRCCRLEVVLRDACQIDCRVDQSTASESAGVLSLSFPTTSSAQGNKSSKPSFNRAIEASASIEHISSSAITMSVPSRLSTAVARQATRLPAVRQTAAVAQQKRSLADASTSSAPFTSPFTRGSGRQDTTAIPDFSKYKNSGAGGSKLFSYFMVGAFGGLSAMGAQETVQSESGRFHRSEHTH